MCSKLTGSSYTATVFGLLAISCAESVVLNVFNAWIFSGPLKAPIFVTATHQMFCFVGALFVWILAPPQFYQRRKIESTSVWLKIMIIPIAFVMNIGMNNLSLQFTTLALNQLIRAFSPVLIAITSFFIEGKVQSLPKLLTLLLLVFGVSLGVATSPDFEFVGFIICALSVIGQATGIVMTAFVMGDKSGSLHVFDVLLYTTLPSLVVLIPWSLGIGEVSAILTSIDELGINRFNLLILIGGILAFTYTLFACILIKLTSSVYYGVTGGFRSALSIAISFQVFPQAATTLSISGIVIAMGAFIANSYFTMEEKLSEEDDELLLGNEKKGLLENENILHSFQLHRRKRIMDIGHQAWIHNSI
mmetsp:Transcript_4429/g.6623  ORF Transcript_4429/g.6623 Transcript_4429/m.6623 type:complete len:361 (+) Transcript_4429:38-1120(+)